MKKAQSALEYLLTYGWAILIIIIVAAALYAMGVFNPAAWSGKRVTGLTYFQVIDWKYTTGGNLSMVLGNKYGKTANVTRITANCAGTTKNVTPNIVLAPNKDTTQVITALPALSAGGAVNCDVSINFRDTQTQFTHTDFGTLSGSTET